MLLAQIISLIALVCYLSLIFISLRQNRRQKVTLAFVLYLTAMAFWQLAAVMVSFVKDPASALFWYRLMTAGMGGQFIFYCLFVLVFVEAKRQKIFFIIGGTLALGLVFSHRTNLIISDVVRSPVTTLFVPTFGELVPVVGAAAYAFLGYGIYRLVRAYQHSRSHQQLNRIRYLLIGAAVIAIGSFSNLYPPLQSFPIDVTANVINAVLIAVAIGRHKLLDISIVVRKGLLYSIPTIIIATAYFLLIWTAIFIFHASGKTQIYISLALAVLTALIAQPLQVRAQSWVDRLFFREKYDSSQMLQRLSRTAASMLNLDSLTNLILEEVTQVIHIDKLAFFLKQDESGEFQLTAQRGLDANKDLYLRKDHPILNWLAKNQKALMRSDIEMMPQFKALWGRERDQLDQLDAELIIPVIAKNELVGIFTLGLKRSEVHYSQDEVLTLMTLANQTAVAIENARLYWQVESTLGELRKTHEELEQHAQDLANAYDALKIENEERLRAEEAIKRYATELERSNQELQQFAYVTSHDLQEPLRMISSYLQLLERRYSNQLKEDAKEFIAYAVDGAKRMQSLINDLLAYSRVGTQVEPFEKVDLEKVVQQAQSNLRVAIDENNATITSDSLPVIYGDASQLTQLFQNLIGNAIKFHSERPPEIHISEKQNNGTHHFTVTDNGIGIEPQFGERIFMIFQRLHPREEYPGTGIGLAICKRIVELHEGNIWVESKYGEGSTFHFTIPCSKGELV